MAAELFTKYRIKNALFYAVILSGVLCNLLAILVESILYGFEKTTILFIVMTAVFLVTCAVGVATGKRSNCILFLLMVADFIEMPIAFYLYGTNMFPFMLFVVVCNAVLIRNKSRRILIPLTLLGFLGVGIINRYHPQKVVSFPDDRYLASMLAFFLVSALLIAISIIMVLQYNNEKDKNKALLEKIEANSKRDELTNAFNKQYADKYIEYMLQNFEAFTMSVYKITSYERIENKYGKQFCDVGIIALADEIFKAASSIALIARYSDSSFIVIYNECDTDSVKEATLKIEKAINDGLSKMINVVSYTDNAKKGESIKTALNRLSIRINGFGE